MSPRQKKDLVIISVIFFIPFCLVLLFGVSGYRYNYTASLPIGIWKASPIIGEVKRGDFISFKAQDLFKDKDLIKKYPGRDRNKFYLKVVMGLPGDTVSYSKNGVSVNGEVLPFSKIVSVNTKGEKIENVQYPVVLKADEYWLMTPHHSGFDSRYYGAVHKKYFNERMMPLWVKSGDNH